MLRLRTLVAASWAAALSLAAGPHAASSDEVRTRWREVWTGADVSQDVWLVYSGATVAPWSHIHGEGVRFRAAGGYGQYRYKDRHGSGGGAPASFRAQTYFADLLAGYQARFGELTAKAFAGASLIGHDIVPFDTETLVIGEEFGVKGVVEFWLNVTPNAWTSLDLSWSSAHTTRAARLRAAYRILPTLSLGIEGGLNFDAQAECRIESGGASACRGASDRSAPPELLDYTRGGLFVRYEWAGGEVSLSGGVLGGSFRGEAASEATPYATLTWISQF